MEQRTAIVAGGSGLIGDSLIKGLLNSEQYAVVIALVRRPLAIEHEKLKQQIIDFDLLTTMDSFPVADDVFCCLGTTQAKAKNQVEYRKVDFHYCYNLAKRALAEGASRFFLVSSLGAEKGSKNSYLNLKGELEHEISLLNYKAFYIFRPSLLLGNRKENRPGERFAQWISQIIPFIGPWKKYKPINAQKVAEAMIKVAAQTQKDVHLYESEMMQHM